MSGHGRRGDGAKLSVSSKSTFSLDFSWEQLSFPPFTGVGISVDSVLKTFLLECVSPVLVLLVTGDTFPSFLHIIKPIVRKEEIKIILILLKAFCAGLTLLLPVGSVQSVIGARGKKFKHAVNIGVP